MLKSIKKRDLTLGMFVVMYGRGTDSSPIVFANEYVESEERLRELQAADVDEFSVDDGLFKAVDAPAPPVSITPEQVARAAALADELPVAEKLYTEALSHARDFMDDVRKGKDVDYHEATPVVDSFIESVFRNDAAAATMFKLKRFDEYSYTHCINVAVLSIILGKHVGLDKATLRDIGIAGMFHDVGKARIPEAILNKPGKLSPQEFHVMKTHVLESYKIMREQKGIPADVLRGILEHHERYDGTGYPRGIARGDIGNYARVISVVDVYDALTSKRCYRDAVPASKALRVMYDWRETTFPPRSIESFIKCIGVYPVGSFVRLSSGEYAVVACNNSATTTRPVVKVVLDANLNMKKPTLVDLAMANLGGVGMEIMECLNPAMYRIDVAKMLTA